MGLKFVVKKKVFGFDTTKTEKYVAQNVITNTVNFRDLCKEISMYGMIPEGAVKHVIDALIDTLNTNLNKGLSVQLGDFGWFRAGISSKSQNTAEEVDADTIQRAKIIFTPGYKFKDMLGKVNFKKGESSVDNAIGGGGIPDDSGKPDEGGGEAPDPLG